MNFAVAIEHAREILDGRLPPTTTALPSDTEVHDLSPSPGSEVDRARTDGEKIYDRRLGEMARVADSLDTAWRRFRDACYSGSIVGVFDHEWFALLTDRAMPDAVAPQCTNYLADLRRDAVTFRTQMQQADTDARRAGVYPGVLRDTRRKYRLEHDAWGR